MADDILDSYLDEDIGDGIPVVVGGQRRVLKGGQIVDVQKVDGGGEGDGGTATTNAVGNSVTIAASKKAGDDDLAGQLKEDELEVKKIEQVALPAKVDVKQVSETDAALSNLSVEAENVSGVKFESEDMRRRFRVMVEAFFKDLRDALETKSKLTMPVTSGGLGFTEEQAQNLMTMLKGKRGDYEISLKSRAEQEKKTFVAQAVEKLMTEQERSERREKEELDRRFAELTGTAGVGTGADVAKKPPSAPSKVIRVEGQTRQGERPPDFQKPEAPHVKSDELAEALKNLLGEEQKKKEPGVAAAAEPQPKRQLDLSPYDSADKSKNVQKPASPLTEKTTSGQSPQNLPVPKGPISPPPPSPKPAPVSASSVSGQNAPVSGFKQTTPSVPHPSLAPSPVISTKPMVSDVKITAKRLMGPVEELRSLTVKDFRRLSKDAREATLKIKDKIDLLGDEQSFEVKTEGVKAWRESGVNQLYLEMLRRSLEGKPIADVITEMEQKGEDVLTKSEFDAIMKLNREIRFG